MTLTCATCRSPISPDAAFCTACGARTSAPVAVNQHSNQPPAMPSAPAGGNGWPPPVWNATPAYAQASAVAPAFPAGGAWGVPAPAARTSHGGRTLALVLAGLIVLVGAMVAAVLLARRAESG